MRPRKFREARLRSIGLILSAVLFALGCRAQGRDEATHIDVVAPLRFPHEKHTARPCASCHTEAIPGETEAPRPGENSHESCMGAECHSEAFKGEPTTLCGLCHESLQTEDGPRASLVPYPPVAGPRSESVSFSHETHLDAPLMETRLGFHVSCTDCHELPSLDGSLTTGALENRSVAISELPRPTHEACARCHAAEAALPGAPVMTACDSCHDAGRTTSRERLFITGDLQFRHSAHRSDRRGKAIGCATCHNSIITTLSESSRGAGYDMRVCVKCHNNDARVSPGKRMSRCETCHATKSAGIGALAPRSHMPPTERPANHTQAFQKDHAADADRPSASCGSCHTMLSGNRRNTCDECHQVMEPRDHVVTWREYDHGPQAATSPDRCATCHQVEFCVACHQSPPRSHFPSLEFRRGGHGTLAVLNMRACVTCHQRANDCSGSGCHREDGL